MMIDKTSNLSASAQLERSIAAKAATRPRVDNQGRLIDPPVTYEYDEFGRMVGKATPSAEPPAA